MLCGVSDKRQRSVTNDLGQIAAHFVGGPVAVVDSDVSGPGHKQDALFFPFAVRRETTVALRKEDIPGLTWHHLIRLTMEELSGRAKLSDLGDRLAAHPKAKKNPHFRDRIRATAYEHPGQYISCGNGFYALNYAVA